MEVRFKAWISENESQYHERELNTEYPPTAFRTQSRKLTIHVSYIPYTHKCGYFTSIPVLLKRQHGNIGSLLRKSNGIMRRVEKTLSDRRWDWTFGVKRSSTKNTATSNTQITLTPRKSNNLYGWVFLDRNCTPLKGIVYGCISLIAPINPSAFNVHGLQYDEANEGADMKGLRCRHPTRR